MKVAIIGGTGLLGSEVVRAFSNKRDAFEVTVISRRQSQGQELPGLRYVTVPTYTDEGDGGLIKALQGQDVLVSMLGGPIAPAVEPVVLNAAIKAKVKLFMPSEYTLDVTHPAARQIGAEILNGERATWADKISEIAASGAIDYTTLVVGGFLDLGLKSGFMGFDIANHQAKLYDDGAHKTTGSTLAFIAQAVVTVLQIPRDRTRNRRIHAVEVEYSGQELLAAFEQETGRKWTVERISTDELKDRFRRALAEGNKRAAYLSLVMGLNFDGSGAANLTSGLTFGEDFGLRRRSLADVVRQVVDESKRSDAKGA